MAKRKIPRIVQQKIERLKKSIEQDGIKIDAFYLFGSYAKGTAHKWSDADVCVVSPSFGIQIKRPLDYLWNKRLVLDDYLIGPIGFSSKDFAQGSPLISEIKKYGVKM